MRRPDHEFGSIGAYVEKGEKGGEEASQVLFFERGGEKGGKD